MILYVVMDPSDSKPLGIFDEQGLAKDYAVKIYDYTGMKIYIEEYQLNNSSLDRDITQKYNITSSEGGMERD